MTKASLVERVAEAMGKVTDPITEIVEYAVPVLGQAKTLREGFAYDSLELSGSKHPNILRALDQVYVTMAQIGLYSLTIAPLMYAVMHNS